jgi:GNAT superfamily N-acetyltransferase
MALPPGATLETPPTPSQQPGIYQRLTASYNPEVEEYAQQHPIFGPVVRFLDAAGGAAMATPEGIANMLMHPSTAASGLMDSIKAWADPNVRRGALSVLPEALGQGVGNVAAGEASGAAGSAARGVVPDIPAAVGTALRTETGALKPAVQVAAKVGGAAAGHALGIPGAGELGGYLLGPKIADILTPERPGAATAAERRSVPITQSPYYDPAAYKAGAASRSTAPAVAPPLGTPENPDIVLAPEPAPTPAGVREGSAFSIPREQLPSLIQQGSAGAGEAYRSAGGKILYVPKEAGYPGPRVEQMSPEAAETFGPKFTAEQYGDGNTRQVTLHQGGQQQGYVLYDIDPKGTAMVNSSLIADPAQGKGLGTQMYDQAIQDAKAAGAKQFTSGSAPEPGAVRVWQSLAKRYPVQKVGNGYTLDLAALPTR